MKILPATEPNPPVANAHFPHFTVAAEEYLKGFGPASVTIRERSILYTVDANGNLVPAGAGSIGFFSEGSVGKRYLLFLPSANPLNSPACTWSRQLGFPTAGIGDNELIQRIRAILQATPTASPSPAPSAAPTEVPTASSTPLPPVGLPPTGSNGEGDGPAIEIAIAAGLGTLVLGAGFVWRIHNQRRV